MSRARLLLAGLLLCSLTNAADAASILISRAEPGSTPITDLSPFTRVGNFTETFENLLGVTMTDLHLTFFYATGQPDTDGDGIFDNSKTTFERSGSSLQFLTVNFQGGPGVPPGGFFTIQTTGFDPDLVFTITPTVPEPGSLVLSASGLAGAALLGLSRRRARA
ncbi:MAG: hypothetical protein BGO49_02650 [Planctomycetales bacterium 71-10]|nr:MAG: hypothetical protein BGO49_02650 [Planctomycetales bacterium 71-10]